MPLEFRELRKQWRKAKKGEAEARALDVFPIDTCTPHDGCRDPAQSEMSGDDETELVAGAKSVM